MPAFWRLPVIAIGWVVIDMLIQLSAGREKRCSSNDTLRATEQFPGERRRPGVRPIPNRLRHILSGGRAGPLVCKWGMLKREERHSYKIDRAGRFRECTCREWKCLSYKFFRGIDISAYIRLGHRGSVLRDRFHAMASVIRSLWRDDRCATGSIRQADLEGNHRYNFIYSGFSLATEMALSY